MKFFNKINRSDLGPRALDAYECIARDNMKYFKAKVTIEHGQQSECDFESATMIVTDINDKQRRTLAEIFAPLLSKRKNLMLEAVEKNL